MPKVALENTTIRSLPLPDKGACDYWDTRLPSFGCRVSQGGSKTFVLKVNNSRRAIGRYPIVSLADARAEAKRLLAEKTLGKNRPQVMTFEQAFEAFLKEKKKVRRSKTTDEYERLIDKHFGFKCQLGAISHNDFAKKLDRVVAPSERDHALVAARVFFTWAVNSRYITDNPTIGISQGKHVARSRVLSDDELKRVWKAAEEMGGSFGTIVRLLLLTGQRRGEIAALQTSWINLDDKTITLPAQITKNRREHTFPIGSLASSALSQSLPSELKLSSILIFPARGKTSLPFNGWSKSKSELDEKSGVSGWTLHDLRRTCASNLAALGIQLPVIERLLNHVSGSFGGIVSVYQKHSFMPEMRAAVVKWEERLLDIVAS